MKQSYENLFKAETGKYPFSFIYKGKESSDILKDWTVTEKSEENDGFRKLYTVTVRDPVSGLAVTYKAAEYRDFPAIEWVLNFKNEGKNDTPILENIRALDINLTRTLEHEYILHHTKGSACSKADFTPRQSVLKPLHVKQLSCRDGRSSDAGGEGGDGGDGSFPFFDIAFDAGGMTVAVGWTGQWEAEFTRDKTQGLRITAGMENIHLKLLPGEEIRSPRILTFFWDGELIYAHNRFRQFILKHHSPQKNGSPVECPLAELSWFKYNYGVAVTEENQIHFIDQFVKNKIDLEYFWIDAGWYEGEGAWYLNVGNWFPKKKAFPNGLKPVADHARKNGMGFVLWFEPERVYPGTWLFNEHPEWLFMPNDEMKKNRQEALLDMGNPEARKWLTDHISTMITENGIGIYRQDFNFPSLGFWRAADAPDRQGISEIRYIEGLYAFWDELLARHPGLIIDNCASGGRRIDLEAISRSVALWRSDYVFDPEVSQAHSISLNQYIPCHATGCRATDAYTFRSQLSAGISLSWDPEKEDFNPKEAQERIKEFKQLRPLFYGDFYPLTAHSISSEAWSACQLERKDLNMGAILIFRRAQSPYTAATFKLHNLDASSSYELTDIDSSLKRKYQGEFLMKEGLEIKIDISPASMILIYKEEDNL